MAEAYGNLISAAYGAVPEEEAPEQQARDGEDFAVVMLTMLGEAPFTLMIDCKGTIGALQNPKDSCGIHNARAHLWGKFHAQFEQQDFTVIKTLAHATATDVAANRTTPWERNGNNRVDELAKKGAALHPCDPKEYWLAIALDMIAYEAATWCGTVAASLAASPDTTEADGDMDDPDDLLEIVDSKGRPIRGRLIWKAPDKPEDLIDVETLHHSLMAAPIVGSAPDENHLLVCTVCGAHGGPRLNGLIWPCVGSNNSAPALSRVGQGKHPDYADRRRLALPLRPLTAAQKRRVAVAVKAGAGVRASSAPPRRDPGADWPARNPGRTRILRCYGVDPENEETFSLWAKMASKKAKKCTEQIQEPEDMFALFNETGSSSDDSDNN